MATYTFKMLINSSINFLFNADTLNFDTSYNAAQISLSQVGADVRVQYGQEVLLLLGITLNQLQTSNFVFANGSAVLLGTTGADTLTGTANNDYIDISTGGADTVSAGAGNDTLYLSVSNLTTDNINGDTGYDTVHLSGSSATPVVLGATNLSNIENLVLDTTGSLSLQLNQANVSNIDINYRTAKQFSIILRCGSMKYN